MPKTLVLAVMIAAGANALAMPTIGVMARPHKRPAGCHDHGGKGSVPAPQSYQCCQTGHNVALVRVSCLPHLASQVAEMLADEPQIAAPTGRSWEPVTVFSGDSPGPTPLRI